MKVSNKILILFAHPALEKSHANRELIQAIQGLENITVRDLYEIYPNFYIDIPQEQELVRAHDILVFQYPFYWYSCPSLLKEWLDLVFAIGFAYGEGGTALRGKKLLNVVTTGGIREAYEHNGINHFTMKELLLPFQQSASFCGMDYLPPFVIHGARQESTRKQYHEFSQNYQSLMVALRDKQFNLKTIQTFDYLNQAIPLLDTPTDIDNKNEK